MGRYRDLRHKVFGKLTVLNRAPNKGLATRWVCRCECGNIRLVAANSLTRGATTSCGKEICHSNYRHGHTLKSIKSSTWSSWHDMLSRCYKPKTKAYKNYGARGICVCDKWKTSFDAFLEDMGEAPKGYTLDRVDNNGDYEPGNCKWSTMQEQATNRRPNSRWLVPKELRPHQPKDNKGRFI